jgi:aryl-alcohol dehydrogenase-like predicted oxidoreductase
MARIYEIAFDVGISYFDSVEVYGRGKSDLTIGKTLE